MNKQLYCKKMIISIVIGEKLMDRICNDLPHSGPNVNVRQKCLFKLLKFIFSLLLRFIVHEMDKTAFQVIFNCF